mgnify:CR=1 FL=1
MTRLTAILLASLFIFSNALIAQETKKERKARYEESKQYKDGKFLNSVETEMGFSVKDFRTLISRARKGPTAGQIPGGKLLMNRNWEAREGMWWSWLGHSTVFMQVEGKKVLIDPIYSDRSSPFQWAGPKRFHEVPLASENMPLPDVIIISHDHYDHLDKETMKFYSDKCKQFFVPLGVGSHLEKWGISSDKITELDWWQHADWNGIEIHCTPARHFSGRGFKKDPTLWASWCIIGKENRIFYSGDTGYFNGFKEIGDKLGPFDLNFMQVGAYDKMWPNIHMFPEEAAQAHLDLKASKMVPLHWGTFNLAFHDWDEPAKRLKAESDSLQIDLFFPILGVQNNAAAKNEEGTPLWWE